MKPAFIITSAINVNVGAFPPIIRLMQMHGTIDSILKHYPDAKLIMVDGGNPIDDSDTQLKEQYEAIKKRVHLFLAMDSNDQIKHLQGNYLNNATNKFEMGGIVGLSKSIAELTLMSAVLDGIKNNDQIKDFLTGVDRIFKISGRLQLSPMHDPSVYENVDKCVFKKAAKSWLSDAKDTIKTEYLYQSRLWSFPANQIDEILNSFESMVKDVMELSTTYYIDVEHLLYKHIGPDRSIELDHLHIFGATAPQASLIYD
jgi:hypothetical protein